MTSAPVNPESHLILLGGGHCHVEVLRHFGDKPEAGLRITVISRDKFSAYSGMLPGLVAGHYNFHDCHIDLPRLAKYAGATFIHAEITALDCNKKRILSPAIAPIDYDILSINTGATPKLPQITDNAVPVIPVKPVEELLGAIEELYRQLYDRKRTCHITVVGGGAGGIEILLAIKYRFSRLNHITGYRLINSDTHILNKHNRHVQSKFTSVLDSHRIEVINNERILKIDSKGIYGNNDYFYETDIVIWATGVSPPDWIRTTDLALDQDGFININQNLQSTSHANIFAGGDIAGMCDMPRAKSGVFAVRQGPVLASNLRRFYQNKSLKAYMPQHQALALISTGDRYAILSRGCAYAAGRWFWRIKDWIDKRFMARYLK
ncbi:MAG: FAD-dependent oxidoreductase [Gammaproteobacteria bacterium]